MQFAGLLDSLDSGPTNGISLGSPESASAPRTSSVADFAQNYGPIAERIAFRLGVDPKIILGQLGLETGWGRSIIPGTNNLGNIKDFSGGGVSAVDNMTGSRDRYRAYATPEAFADDYASLIQRKYPNALNARDPMAFGAALKQGGYAEDPRYVDKVVQASRMASSAPGPVMNTLGKAVGALMPSANAQPSNQRGPMNDAPSDEWAALNSQFSPGAGQQAQPAGDPWAELNAQFAQPTAQREAPVQQGQAKPQEGLVRSALKGFASGFADLGNTLINHASVSVVPNGANPLISPATQQEAVTARNAERQASLAQFNKENDSLPFGIGRFVGNVAATAPVGGVLGAGVKGAASLPMLSRAAPLLEAAGNAISSGGMRTGLAPSTIGGMAGNVGLRMAGGAINGGASAGLIDPNATALGAGIGAVIPPAVGAVGKGFSLAGQALRRVPEDTRAAQSIMSAGGYRTPEEIAAVRAAIAQYGPSIVPEGPTVPQILQNPGISQLQRTMRNSGETALLEREAAQNAARLSTLDRVSPVTGNVQQSAENFGNALQTEVRAADEAARRRTQSAFDAVDPFDETRFVLPIEQMQQAQQRFLGRGTFNGGANATRAIDTARNIGEQTIEPVAPARAGLTQDEQTLAQAVRRAGGINTATPAGQSFAGELRDLRQTPGLRGIANNGRGQPLDALAERMHADGFIPDPDPATLLNHLRDPSLSSGRGAAADPDRTYRALQEAAQGDAPGATTIARPVPFREVQNLRSSIGEAHADAVAKGRTREAAALDQMRREIDTQVDNVATGNGQAGENFPADIVNQWREGLALHQDRMQRFRTGPQASMFRQGGDGLPAAQGAELAPKFFSPRGSQADDIAAFGKVSSPETAALLKNYAITDAASQTDRLGNLSNAKFQKWLDFRSGAVAGLLDDGEQAALRGVAADLARADNAASLGMAKGSNTAQNVQDALRLGLLDNKAVGMLANRIPYIGQFTGPMLESLKATAKKGQVERISGLLADPAALDAAIADSMSRSVRSPGLLEGRGLLPLLLRSSPVAASGSDRP